MLASLGGSASKLRPAKWTLTPVKTRQIPPNFLPRKRVTFVPQEFAICPDVGSSANGTDCTMATSLRPQVQRSEALMWKITTHDFTLQQVLIMAAMNVAPALIATDKGERTIWRSRTHRDSLASRRLSWQK